MKQQQQQDSIQEIDSPDKLIRRKIQQKLYNIQRNAMQTQTRYGGLRENNNNIQESYDDNYHINKSSSPVKQSKITSKGKSGKIKLVKVDMEQQGIHQIESLKQSNTLINNQNHSNNQKKREQIIKKLSKEDISSSDDSDNNEHNIWENHILRWRGIDCDNTWTGELNNIFNLFNLFKARYESFPSKKEIIGDLEVIDYMKRFSRTRSLKKDNYPWTNFKDQTNYRDDFEGTLNSVSYKTFKLYYDQYKKAFQDKIQPIKGTLYFSTEENTENKSQFSVLNEKTRINTMGIDNSPQFKIRKSNLNNNISNLRESFTTFSSQFNQSQNLKESQKNFKQKNQINLKRGQLFDTKAKENENTLQETQKRQAGRSLQKEIFSNNNNNSIKKFDDLGFQKKQQKKGKFSSIKQGYIN